MSARSVYVCQIQCCNIILVLMGLLAMGLAGSQFSKVGIDDYRDIDLRLLGWIHLLTGAIGIYSILQNHGSIVTKTLYCVSFVIGFATAVFYGFTTYRIAKAHEHLNELRTAQGFLEDFQQESHNFAGRLVVSALMIADGALAALVSLISLFILTKIVVITIPLHPLQSRDQEIAIRNAKWGLSTVGLIKVVLGLGVLGLCVFIEYEHENVSGIDRYIKIALDHIACMLTIVSGVVDIIATLSKSQQQLNLKVALIMSVVSATWCLKSVDNNAMPYYKDDLKYYYRGREQDDRSITSTTSPRYILAVAHGVLLGCLGILFILCVFSCIIVGTFLQLDYHSINTETRKALRIQNRLVSALHFLWGSCMMALTILGLLDSVWRGEFLGADLLWVSILFCTTAIMTSTNYSVMITTKFVLNVVCLGISVEKMCASINIIYQFSSYPPYTEGNKRQLVGQIVLISCQCGIFAAEALTSLYCSIIFGREISKKPNLTYRHSTGIHGIFSLGTLFYAVVLTGCYVVFEVGKWKYNEVPSELPFFRLGNGPLSGAVFVVQMMCVPFPGLLAASSILNTIIASIALFTVSSSITNVYYLQRLLQATDLIPTTSVQETIYQVAIILSAAAALACIICTLCAVICSLRSSYILHHRSSSPDSTVVAPLGDDQFGSGSLQIGTHMRAPSRSHVTQASPTGGVQLMEEQSVYWSADENPFYYHTSKRFYGQPYQIDSGFYGYTLANAGESAQQPNRRIQSSAAQTQIGHVFT